MSFIITPKELHEKILANEVIVIDVRSHLQEDDYGIDQYEESHLPGAFFLDIEQDLSGEVEKHGGNHPLPDPFILSETLTNFGVTYERPIVFYDDGGGMFAPRAWWILHYYGHKHVFILDGGYSAWVENGYEVTKEIPKALPAEKQFIPNVDPKATVTMEEVRNRPSQTVLIDSRALNRYLGKEEPLYKKAGRIPGAVNYFWEDLFDENQKLKDRQRLKEHFEKLDQEADIIVSCGSGVSACPNILALKQLGYKNVKLYPGSYSDWISYEENDVETGDYIDNE